MTSQIQQALHMIQPGMTVSLGGGRHMQALAAACQQQPVPHLTFCSPAEPTRAVMAALALPVTDHPDHIDVAFDGCDSITPELTLLKSRGGIFIQERRYAAIADQYVILVPASRWHPLLDPSVPLTLAVAPDSGERVLADAAGRGLHPTTRSAGNPPDAAGRQTLLIDCHATSWANIASTVAQFMATPGVRDTSYFAGLATAALVEAEDGTCQMIKKGALR